MALKTMPIARLQALKSQVEAAISAKVGSIREIDAKPITYTPEYLTGYGLKSLKHRFSMDEIVIFPRTVSELPANGPDPRNGPVRAAAEKPIYNFQRT
jgi:hypothetical protein